MVVSAACSFQEEFSNVEQMIGLAALQRPDVRRPCCGITVG